MTKWTLFLNIHLCTVILGTLKNYSVKDDWLRNQNFFFNDDTYVQLFPIMNTWCFFICHRRNILLTAIISKITQVFYGSNIHTSKLLECDLYDLKKYVTKVNC